MNTVKWITCLPMLPLNERELLDKKVFYDLIQIKLRKSVYTRRINIICIIFAFVAKRRTCPHAPCQLFEGVRVEINRLLPHIKLYMRSVLGTITEIMVIPMWKLCF